MKNQIFIIISIIATLGFYYFLYDFQKTQNIHLINRLDIMDEKLDSLLNLKSENTPFVSTVDYKDNNIVKNKIIDFADSLNKLLGEEKFHKVMDESKNKLSSLEIPVIDTICYDLSEQYKIINFYKNKIRLKNILVPGSILMSINDTLTHNEILYILNEINGEGGYIKLYNTIDGNECKFHKATP